MLARLVAKFLARVFAEYQRLTEKDEVEIDLTGVDVPELPPEESWPRSIGF